MLGWYIRMRQRRAAREYAECVRRRISQEVFVRRVIDRSIEEGIVAKGPKYKRRAKK